MSKDNDLERWLDISGHQLLQRESDDFPAMIGEIPDAPELLYVDGDPDVLHLPSLAIVGSRNPTRQGKIDAYEFARYLGSAGFCIVSGLAQGIDAAAHQGALDGGGKTVAFLGHGIDTVYPASNKELAARIRAQGALCSEFPLGLGPRRELFPQRNRLISGLSLGTIVVEAAKRSGSLITARLASEQGREVFAIPGSIHNPLARGCHQLIRQGAKLVESAGDIVSELGSLTAHLAEIPEQTEEVKCRDRDGDRDYENLLDVLGFDPISTDELAAQSGLTIDQVSSMLLILELEGKIEAQPGGRYSRLHR